MNHNNRWYGDDWQASKGLAFADKPIKASRRMAGRKCEGCKYVFRKGDIYYRRRKSVGSPGKQTVEKCDGHFVAYVDHGFTFTVLLCPECKVKYWKETL